MKKFFLLSVIAFLFAAAFTGCENMMDNLRTGFEKLHEIDDEGPVMQNAHQVYAGLTYGKGTLNESLEGADYSKRGFLA